MKAAMKLLIGMSLGIGLIFSGNSFAVTAIEEGLIRGGPQGVPSIDPNRVEQSPQIGTPQKMETVKPTPSVEPVKTPGGDFGTDKGMKSFNKQ